MKYPLTNHRCINPDCLHEELSYKCPDAWRCTKCSGLVISELIDDSLPLHLEGNE